MLVVPFLERLFCSTNIVKGFWEISGSILNTPPYVYGHNFWTDAPNSKIQGILKTRDQWLSFYNKMKEINLFSIFLKILLEGEKGFTPEYLIRP